MSFDIGDVVVISTDEPDFREWDGFKARVLDGIDHYGDVYLEPLSDRPDGLKRPLTNFFWPASQLEHVER